MFHNSFVVAVHGDALTSLLLQCWSSGGKTPLLSKQRLIEQLGDGVDSGNLDRSGFWNSGSRKYGKIRIQTKPLPRVWRHGNVNFSHCQMVRTILRFSRRDTPCGYDLISSSMGCHP